MKGGSHFGAMGGFTQFGFRYMNRLVELGRQSQPAITVFLWLANNASSNNSIRISGDKISRGVNLSRSAVFDALKRLEHEKFILREDNVIHLNAWVVWRGKGPATPFNAKLMTEPGISITLPEVQYCVVKHLRLVPKRKTA